MWSCSRSKSWVYHLSQLFNLWYSWEYSLSFNENNQKVNNVFEIKLSVSKNELYKSTKSLIKSNNACCHYTRRWDFDDIVWHRIDVWRVDILNLYQILIIVVLNIAFVENIRSRTTKVSRLLSISQIYDYLSIQMNCTNAHNRSSIQIVLAISIRDDLIMSVSLFSRRDSKNWSLILRDFNHWHFEHRRRRKYSSSRDIFESNDRKFIIDKTICQYRLIVQEYKSVYFIK